MSGLEGTQGDPQFHGFRRTIVNWNHIESVARNVPPRNDYSETRWARVENVAKARAFIIKNTENRWDTKNKRPSRKSRRSK